MSLSKLGFLTFIQTVLNIILRIKMTLDRILKIFVLYYDEVQLFIRANNVPTAQLQSYGRDQSQIAVVLHRGPHTGEWKSSKGKIPGKGDREVNVRLKDKVSH